ncbi:MAG: Fis family transcriptional regulator [Blastopirellula sp.]|nr:Fis family transcriptional regulator [Blastopirellula sp.]
MARLLIVDDEPAIGWGLQRVAESLGHEARTTSSAESALEQLQEATFDLVILDVRLPGMDGLTAIEQIRTRAGDVPIILITAFGDLETAVAAVRSQVFDYLVKPFDVEKVRGSIVRALQQPVSAVLSDGEVSVAGFVGTTPIMQEAFSQIALAAASEACVLIQGESGTGKELAAHAIHRHSAQSEGPFVVVNVASLSEALAESELFGHVRGAFTGAEQDRAGLLQQADGGTLFLDELAEIPLPLQVKLLRVLETGVITPVGAETSRKINFRLISATHRNLLGEVEQGRFRHDLYFRISAFQVNLPALRERVDDIVPLAEYFLRTLSDDKASQERLSREVGQALRARQWYGNVRELRNAIEHAMILARGGAITAEHLPPAAPASVMGGNATSDSLDSQIQVLLRQWAEKTLGDAEQAGDLHDRLLALVEPPALEQVLSENGHQFAASARVLGMHRTTLRKKAEQYGLDKQ